MYNNKLLFIKQFNPSVKNLKLGLVTHNDYKNYCNKLKTVINNAKTNYYNNAFSNYKNNIKQTWKLINDLICSRKSRTQIRKIIVNNDEITKDHDIASHFNNYFSNIPISLNHEIPNSATQPCDFLNVNYHNSFYCRPTKSVEIGNIILKLKNSRSDLNLLPVKILKLVYDILSAPISLLINCSFSTGIFPETLKDALIVPMFKKGEPTDIGNYRPISILPTLSKILEKCMVFRINDFITKFSIVTVSQFGFRKNLSTVDALEKYSDLIYNSFDAKLFNVSLFIDLRKAFDMVNHSILLGKLERYGFRGPTLNWLGSYLKDRKQSVRIGSCLSDKSVVNIGVPQGSSLSPVLFLMYINDMVNLSNNFNVLLFADDTTLSTSGSNFSQLVDTLNLELGDIADWMAANRLSLNIDKTYALTLERRRCTTPLERLTGHFDRLLIFIVIYSFIDILDVI